MGILIAGNDLLAKGEKNLVAKRNGRRKKCIVRHSIVSSLPFKFEHSLFFLLYSALFLIRHENVLLKHTKPRRKDDGLPLNVENQI